VVEGEDGAPSDGGVCAPEEAVLGAASVGVEILLLQFGGHNRWV
jgi:hypothetical protein